MIPDSASLVDVSLKEISSFYLKPFIVRTMTLKISKTKTNVAKEFAAYLASLIDENQTVHIALSGGSTPKSVFDELAQNYRHQVAWEKVQFYWGDERCVPPSDEQSNFKMTQTHLLSKIVIPEANIHRIRGEDKPSTEAKRYTKVLENTLPISNGLPQFDLVILGLGDDGHTASIFPHEIALWDSKNCCEVAVQPESGQRRITITGGVINNAKTVAFLVTGTNKSGRVRQILQRESGHEQLPASLVAPISGNLLWFLDGASAKDIT
jgi:6-phosphogluconolactonase